MAFWPCWILGLFVEGNNISCENDNFGQKLPLLLVVVAAAAKAQLVVALLQLLVLLDGKNIRVNIQLLLEATSAVFHCSISSHPPSCSRTKRSTIYMSSDWSEFSALDDEDELDELHIDTRDYAAEEDSQEAKAQIGASLEPPTIEDD